MYSSAYNISIEKGYREKIKQNSKENELKKYTPHNLFSFHSFLWCSSFFILNFSRFRSPIFPFQMPYLPLPFPLLDVLNILYIILYINNNLKFSTNNID